MMEQSRGNNLDPWYDSYASRTSGLAASEEDAPPQADDRAGDSDAPRDPP